MNVAQLFPALFLAPKIEVVVALLPEVRRVADQPAGHALLEGLDGNGKRFAAWLAQQQMHMVGHDNVPIDTEQVVLADSFQRGFEHGPGSGICEVRPTMPARKRDEMRLSGTVESLKPSWHEGQLTPVPHSSKRRLSGPPAFGDRAAKIRVLEVARLVAESVGLSTREWIATHLRP